MRKLFLFILVFASTHGVLAQTFDSKLYSKLQFRFIGPDGNRMISVAGEPGNPNVSYSGAASGGLWKTEDGGITWKSVFDDTEESAIGAIGISPSHPRQVWVGTGETFLIRPAHAVGNGVYKSSDAGKTWKNMG
ncbi:MAG: glycosyl hydrolase, partial [Cyclobacteriaceae bacterium]|nr:glycosyl hydrolase [Cyclobacteriaceae bacterium]